MNEKIYKYVEVTYVDGKRENIELATPFSMTLDSLENLSKAEWHFMYSMIGAYIINKDQIRSLRFHND
jgi:hypothetical protein